MSHSRGGRLQILEGTVNAGKYIELCSQAKVVVTLEVSGRFYGFTSEQLRQLAYEFAVPEQFPYNQFFAR